MLGGFSGGFLGFGWQAQFGSSLMSKKGNLSVFPLRTLATLGLQLTIAFRFKL